MLKKKFKYSVEGTFIGFVNPIINRLEVSLKEHVRESEALYTCDLLPRVNIP